MNGKKFFWALGKLLLSGLAFVAGAVLGGGVARMLGIPIPTIPGGIDPAKAGQLIPLVGVLLAAVLGILSKNTEVRFLPRWIILSLFSWTAYGLNNYLEAKFFMPASATSYVLVTNFTACCACSAMAAWLFKPIASSESFGAKTRAFFAARSIGSWTWRLVGGLAAFPLVYFVFGWLVSPFVLPYYQEQYAGLALPTQGTMLLLSAMRSLLFLLSILPVLVTWKGQRTALFLALGGALFMMVGGLNMLQAVWLPLSLRGAHSIEILADSLTHAAALVFLLVPGTRSGSQVHIVTNRLEAG